MVKATEAVVGRRSSAEPEKQPWRTLRCRECGMMWKQAMEQERSHPVDGTEPSWQKV